MRDDALVGRFERTGHRITGDRTRQRQGRGIGWDYLYLAVDDRSRLADAEILPDGRRNACPTFPFDARRFFRRHGVAVERVMTGNGPAFKPRRYAKALRRPRIRSLRGQPVETPQRTAKQNVDQRAIRSHDAMADGSCVTLFSLQNFC